VEPQEPALTNDDPEYAANDGEGVEAEMEFVDASRWFGVNLKFVREKLGESQTGLAKRMADLGFPWHQTTVSRIEAGERPAQLGEAWALCRLLQVDLKSMIERPSTVRINSMLTNTNMRILKALEQVHLRTREVILARAELEAHIAAAREVGGLRRSVQIAEHWLTKEPEDAVREGRKSAEEHLRGLNASQEVGDGVDR
jgi:transcriptional regulator with XRE-family HTH domain